VIICEGDASISGGLSPNTLTTHEGHFLEVRPWSCSEARRPLRLTYPVADWRPSRVQSLAGNDSARHLRVDSRSVLVVTARQQQRRTRRALVPEGAASALAIDGRSDVVDTGRLTDPRSVP
jgi:hypothetical protein